MLSKFIVVLLLALAFANRQPNQGPVPNTGGSVEPIPDNVNIPVDEGQVKLEEGILSVFHNGSWGAVCDDYFDLNYLAADVVCKQINGQDFRATIMEGGHSCRENQFWLDDVSCSGWEQRIVECSHLPYGDHNCSTQSECVYIECGNVQQNTGDLPPSQSADENWQPWDGFISLNGGLVEVFTLGQWSQICASDNVTWETADIGCRQVFGNTYWAAGVFTSDYCPNQQFLHDISCSGFEQFVIDCPHTVDNSCDTGCYYLSCYENVPPPEFEYYSYPYLEVNWDVPDGQIDWYSGIVSIYHNNEVRGLCDDFVDQSTLSGDVLCRQIYGQGFTASSLQGGQRCPHEDFWLDDLQCQGFEVNIDDCFHLPWGQHNCSTESECLLLSCQPLPAPQQEEESWYTEQQQNTSPQYWQENQGFEGQLSLASGVLQIFHDNQWGLICDDYFDYRAADVACTQLYGANYKADSYLGNQWCGDQPSFLLDDVSCYGNEQALQDCRHNEYGVNDCWQNECVNVQCYYEDPEAEFEDSTLVINDDGIVTVYHSGQWGNVCDDGFTWNYNNMWVACQQANGEFSYPVNWEEGRQCPYENFWLDQVNCYGYEQNISQCDHQSWGQHDCNPQYECIYLECGNY